MPAHLNTKERLLHVACEFFADKGYRDTTVAEICEAAEANIAAVNYHFGDKSNLYRKVWAYLFEKSAEKYPLPSDLTETEPETWLRHFIHSRIQEIFDNGINQCLPQILHREMGEPTEMHEELFRKYLQPGHEQVKKAVRALLGPEATENQLKLAILNFLGVHIFLNVRHQKSNSGNTPKQRIPSLDNPAELARQIEEFAIGGLLATRHLIQSTGN
ncbi:TetR/AcrR family transcriptional regulator [Pontiellaceae bacterium B12227]|nr:TetR/AcrR family transcriptional regulator [Pontiellaceae bacterium B12227]